MSVACYKDFTIKVIACDDSTDWLNNPGSCRLRIRNYDPGMFGAAVGCFDARLGGVQPWDGSFSNRVWNPAVPGWDYWIDYALFQTIGGVFIGLTAINALSYNVAASCWQLWLAYNTNGGPDGGLWRGSAPVSINPIQTYNVDFVGYCLVLPATVDIEGYSL